MSNDEGPSKIIRTSGGSTRLTASKDGGSKAAGSAPGSAKDKAGAAGEAASKPADKAAPSRSDSADKASSGSQPSKASSTEKPSAEKPSAETPSGSPAASGPGRIMSTSKGVRIGGKKEEAPVSSSSPAAHSSTTAASNAGSGPAAGVQNPGAGVSGSRAGASSASAPTGSAPSTRVMQTSGTTATARGSQAAPAADGVKAGGGTKEKTKVRGKERKGPRTVKLGVAKVDPWSVMKMTFMLALALGIAMIVVAFVLWLVLEVTGTFNSAQQAIAEFAGEEGATELLQVFGLGRILGFTVIIAVVNVILITALSTLTAFIYNIGSSLVGGFHLTLTDE